MKKSCDGIRSQLRSQAKNVIAITAPPDIRDLGSSLKKSDAVVLGVSKDGIESHNKFAGKYKLPFTLLSDPKTEVMKKYGAFGKKLMYGKEVQGTIRSTVVIGPKGDVIKHWPAVKKAEAHPEEVLAFLKQQKS